MNVLTDRSINVERFQQGREQTSVPINSIRAFPFVSTRLCYPSGAELRVRIASFTSWSGAPQGWSSSDKRQREREGEQGAGRS